MIAVPAAATTGAVVVTVNSVSTTGPVYTVGNPPAITSLAPPTGAAGDSVTIYGSHFGASQSSSTITFNGAIATANS